MLVNGSLFIVHCSLVNLVNMDNMDNLVKWLNGSVQGRPDLHFVSIFTNDAFWSVSADTKTCGSPL